MDTKYLRALIATAAAAVLRFFTPSIDRILADIQKKIDQLNRMIDQANDQADACVIRRNALRAEIDATYAEQNANSEAALRASKVRSKLEDIVR